MEKYIIAFCIIILYKILLNSIRILQCNKYMNEYLSWIEDRKISLVRSKNEIISLWKAAGLRDKVAPRTQPTGLGQIVNYRKSVFDSFPDDDQDMAYASMLFFNEAIGIFKSRLKKTLIPFYWIEGVLFFPKIVLEYFGSKNEIAVKLIQGLYWIIGVIFTGSSRFRVGKFHRSIVEASKQTCTEWLLNGQGNQYTIMA